MIRSAIVALFLILYTLLLGPPLILHALLTGSVDLLYRLGVGGVVFIVQAVGARIRVEGRENIPPGVCIFVANHTSTADPPAIVGAIPRRIAILAKKSLFRIPIVGQAFRLARFVPVDRADREAAVASVDKAVEYLKEGMSFLIYPEGTRSPDGRLLPFKKGAFVMAIKAGTPIVPVAVAGAHRVMRKKELRIHPGEITVRFQPPIEAAGYTLERRDALAARVHAALAAGLPPDQQPAC
ncbi:MAG TPA: lysophospholipid acyltransferase family protein [Candidatus Acidoferrales bacterium]|jgi:1-acyl-sn-glycerol-3-phosphate acyltransferase|nr:lysophospholipid acyltransferase family protein [Candidatus Acidoferrales bacterium]